MLHSIAPLPARVEGILSERIARLSSEHQQFLQLACVEGETFTAQTIATIQQRNLSDVVHHLSGVLDRQHHLIVAETTVDPTTETVARYRFRHILFQHYVYRQLDPVERRQTHADIAHALETLHHDSASAMAVPLAHHFEQGGRPEKAMHYLLLAGQRANQMVAQTEAIIHLENGLALLQELPETPVRHCRELDFHLAAAPAHRIVNGICCLYYHAWLLWLRGYLDQALAQILATRQAAAQSKHPFDMVVLVFEW